MSPPRRSVPDIGALVDFGRNSHDTGPGQYRVTGWLRPFVKKPLPEGDVLAALAARLIESLDEDEPPRERLEWCLRDEATHVSLYGICGAIAHIDDCDVTGMVGWSEATLAGERRSAEQMAANRDDLSKVPTPRRRK